MLKPDQLTQCDVYMNTKFKYMYKTRDINVINMEFQTILTAEII
jgi:hypothetical protein